MSGGPPEFLDPYNAAYAQELYERWLSDPSSVDESWRRIFAVDAAGTGLIEAAPDGSAAPSRLPAIPSAAGGARRGGADSRELLAAKAAAELVDAYRLVGHRAARLDPLGSEPQGHPMLDPAFHGVSERDLEEEGVFAALVGEIYGWLRQTYSGHIGYEFEHLEDPARREWLRDQIETGAHLRPLSEEQKVRLLERISEVEGLEQFLHRAYLGQKRFSIEGLDMMVPMLDLAIERAAAGGAREVVLGMAHRGRLNVLAHVLGRPHTWIIGEFEGRHDAAGTGDVKYHRGAEGTYATASGEPLTVSLAPNPSHLEFVNPVVEGIARAKQEERDGRELHLHTRTVLPVLIHGDAAFSAQGVVAETLNVAELRGYTTGGTLHLIANNQIGFTTDPKDARSTYYASDLALGFNIPVVHVNADDPEACLAAVRVALAYRERFHADFVIDLVGYRRYGHNEGDEPAYTQPILYEKIAEHPTVRALWAERLVAEGVVTAEEAEAIGEAVHQRLVEAQDQVRASPAEHSEPDEPEEDTHPSTPDVATAVEEESLRELHRQLHIWPEGFSVHAKLRRQLEKRAEILDDGTGPIDWAHAESLAFASLVAQGTPIRLTGQDVVRGTFSHRHLVLHDVETGESFCPVGHLPQASAPFAAYNSPLSEVGALGFEYGYTTAAGDALVIWEAQFGDFMNGAQVIIDQFLVAGRAKWGQLSGLTLLLPHGYEGQGPEHSSARLERFLQLAAEDNIRVANCTTPAQYFHLLRRQALAEERRPLVVCTPKSLLRHPKSVSDLADLAGGAFQPLIDHAAAAERADRITRVVLCSGKVYYDLLAHDGEGGEQTAVLRLEQLYPFPAGRVREALERYAAAEEVLWVQEEPRNMGAWRFVEPRLRDLVGERPLRYVGRPDRASPAEGFASVHQEQQSRIVRQAFAARVAAR